MENQKFKIGDSVIPLPRQVGWENEDPSYVNRMLMYERKAGIIKEVSASFDRKYGEYKKYNVEFEGSYWWYREDWLEPLNPPISLCDDLLDILN